MGKIKQKNIKREFLLTLKSKERYRWFKDIQRYIKEGKTAKEACKLARVSRGEYYYWKRRVDEILSLMKEGCQIRPKIFRDLSSKPHISPNQVSDTIRDLIIKIRKKTNAGAEYVAHQLLIKHQVNISTSGVQKVIKRAGLIKKRKYHQKKKEVFISRQYEPGEKVQIDTKHLKDKNGKKFYQYSAIDLATGIIYKRIYENIDPRSSCNFLLEVVDYLPFRIHRIQTDNGFEYTWRLNPDIKQIHSFTLQCKILGYEHILIPPASPTYNSHVERTHRIDKQELWNKKKYSSLQSMKKDLKKYVTNFNHNRATKSKNWMTPIEYTNHKFDLNISKLKYRVRKVCN